MGQAKGGIFEAWSATPHSKAFAALGEANQTNKACLGCHTTGSGKAMAAGKTDKDLQGVQCEACHGPGSEYKAMAIMKDKEQLLSIDEPLRFIFSHSELREGWDNPNVFQICTLNETKSAMKKRQEIGRGLRLPVDQDGKRVPRNDTAKSSQPRTS